MGRIGNRVDGLVNKVFKIQIIQDWQRGGSALVAEICAGPHNRLLRRQHCSSLCSQSEGHEHVANMASALGHDFIGYSARACSPRYSSPSLCEQSELQCFASVLRLGKNGIFYSEYPLLVLFKKQRPSLLYLQGRPPAYKDVIYYMRSWNVREITSSWCSRLNFTKFTAYPLTRMVSCG